MQNITQQDARQLVGCDVFDSDGDRIGTLEQIYVDETTGQPEWLAVTTGWFGIRATLIPISGANSGSGGVTVRWDKATVKGAPTVDADGYLDEKDEARLYRYYGVDFDQSAASTTSTAGRDEAMTRSEEELRVGKMSQETGRVRLRKWVETEQVETAVPVAKETARVVREPITDANIDDALRGPDITESEHEVVLHEERAVVQKETVPKERVRLEKETVTGEAQVSESLRKEHIEVEDETGTTTRGTTRR